MVGVPRTKCGIGVSVDVDRIEAITQRSEVLTSAPLKAAGR
jgi:hypothetical protein